MEGEEYLDQLLREDRVGSHNRGDPSQDLSAQRLPFGNQAATLVFGQTQASPAQLKLLFQNAVLFDQIGDQGRLLAADPAGERSQ